MYRRIIIFVHYFFDEDAHRTNENQRCGNMSPNYAPSRSVFNIYDRSAGKKPGMPENKQVKPDMEEIQEIPK